MRVQFNRPDRPTVDARGRTIPNCVGDWSDTSWSWPVNTACVDAANPVPDDQPRDGGTGQPATARAGPVTAEGTLATCLTSPNRGLYPRTNHAAMTSPRLSG